MTDSPDDHKHFTQAVTDRGERQDVGAVPQQLEQLGDESLDEVVRTELTLITQEACWQLRTRGREAYRRWQLQADESYPPVFEQWLAAVDTMVAKLAALLPAVAPAGEVAQPLGADAADAAADKPDSA